MSLGPAPPSPELNRTRQLTAYLSVTAAAGCFSVRSRSIAG
jgi:hypothetical protein